MRKVVLKLTTQKDVITHETAATTFGELKKEMRQIKWDGMRVVERESKMTLQVDEAVLPQGEFLLFLVPEKVKSGRKVEGGVEKLDDINAANYNELRSHMSWLNRNKGCSLNMQGGTEDLRRRLKDYYRRQKDKPAAKPAAKKPEPIKKKKEKKSLFKKKEKESAPASDPITTIEEARERMNKAIDEIVLNAIDGKSTVLQYSLDDLDKEIKQIHNALKTSRGNARYID